MGASKDDAFIPFLKKWRSEGYHVFFGIYELMADNFNISTPGECHIYHATITDWLGMSWKKIEKILADCGKIKNNKGIYPIFEKDSVHLKCPYLKELGDEYTEKKLRKMGLLPKAQKDNVGTMSGQCRSLDKIREDKIREDPSGGNTNLLISPYSRLADMFNKQVCSSVPKQTTIKNFEDYKKRGGDIALLEKAIMDQDFMRGEVPWKFLEALEKLAGISKPKQRVKCTCNDGWMGQSGYGGTCQKCRGMGYIEV